MRRAIVGLFALLCVVQLWLPASMIAGHERTRREGTLHRFRAALVDPADPFLGRYVQVSLEANLDASPGESTRTWDQLYYVELGEDTEGFANVVAVFDEAVPGGNLVAVRYRGPVQRDPEAIELRGERFALIADRYYLNEKLAPEAERLWAERLANRGAGDPEPWAEVRVLDGRAAIVGLFVGNQRIEDAIRGTSPSANREAASRSPVLGSASPCKSEVQL